MMLPGCLMGRMLPQDGEGSEQVFAWSNCLQSHQERAARAGYFRELLLRNSARTLPSK